ncbi:hypothetical protein KRX51_01960 [Corynebacterium sp. TAE3-ERU12]|uniref:DUF6541 family protein n=1 Tax=Corynebacterium sp. TAE3-ERU12 TaxID=2849491 RepID=UPI001C468D1E|nr:DUF6541 family protein [Corynebacterium sp. TAE3-ERU12]MBV7294683.1 hypothetical protein [Corynebacterium sp. TAE3-ERU12]
MSATAAVLLLVLFVPGLILARIAGMGWDWSIAAAPAMSIGLVGTAAWVLGFGLPFTPTTVLLCFVLLAIVLAAARFLARRLSRRKADVVASADTLADADVAELQQQQRRQQWQSWAIAAAGVTGAALALFVPAWRRLAAIGGPESVPQQWDVLWHASVLRFLDNTEVVSPTRMGELNDIENGFALFYPTGWHALVGLAAQISGANPVEAVNTGGLLLPAVLTPLAAGCLAWRICDRPGLLRGVAAAIAAVATVAAPTLYPIGIGVGAWPYQVAVALAVIVFTLVVSVPRHPSRLLATAGALLGATVVHPSALPLVAMLSGIYWLFAMLWSPARPELGAVRARLRDMALLAAPFLFVAVFVIPQWYVLFTAKQSEEIQGVDATVAVSRTESWRQAVLMLTRHALELNPVWPLLLIGGVGLIIAAVWWRSVWAPLAWLVCVITVVHGLVPFSGIGGTIISAYTGLHYATPHRLVMPEALLYAAGCGVAVAAIMGLVVCYVGKHRTGVGASVLAVLTLIVGSAGIWWSLERTTVARDFSISAQYDGRVVGEADLRAFDWLAKQPEATEHTIFINPNEGSGWMYPRNNLNSAFRHNLWPPVDRKKSDLTLLFWHADKIGAGVPGDPWALNKLDEAVEHLDVAFYYISPPNYWEDTDYIWPMLDGVWWAPGTTPVYKDGPVGIVAVNRMVGREAIVRMRAESPEPMPALPTREEASVAEPGAPDAAMSYVFMPGEPPKNNPPVPGLRKELPPPAAPRPPIYAVDEDSPAALKKDRN